MHTLQLLLAAQVRALAVDLRNAERSHYYAGIYGYHDEAERTQMLAEWDQQNPLSKFIQMALIEIQKVDQMLNFWSQKKIHMSSQQFGELQ